MLDFFRQEQSIEFTGPFPVRINSTNTRLKDFVNFIAHKVNIRSIFTPDQLDRHTKYIEKKVNEICMNISKKRKEIKIKEIRRRGSYYDESKILFPDEYDFLPILTLTGCQMVEVESLSDDQKICAKQGYRKIKVNEPDILRHSPGCIKEIGIGKARLTSKFIQELKTSVRDALDEIEDVKFIGEKDHEKNSNSSDPLNTVSIHRNLHGPSIWIRIGGPLCMTDIDLCFCIEGQESNLGPCVLVKSKLDHCPYCKSENDHWIETPINPPEQYMLTPDHQKLLLTLKYISHFEKKMFKRELLSTSSSYYLKALLVDHQKNCQSENVGECFDAVTKYTFRLDNDTSDSLSNDIHVRCESRFVPDIFHQKEVKCGTSYFHIVLLWFLRRIKEYDDTTWWPQLDQALPNSYSIWENETLPAMKMAHANIPDTSMSTLAVDIAIKLNISNLVLLILGASNLENDSLSRMLMIALCIWFMCTQLKHLSHSLDHQPRKYFLTHLVAVVLVGFIAYLVYFEIVTESQ
ncbi:unnamed protein product, partial [Owenia fusiformis]